MDTHEMRAVLIAALGITVIAATGSLAAAQSDAASRTDSPGRDVYEAACTRCHGPDGRGGKAPTLVPFGWNYSQALDIVRHGSSCGMPAFKESELSDEELKQIVDYLKALTEHVSEKERLSHGSIQYVQTGPGGVHWSAALLRSRR